MVWPKFSVIVISYNQGRFIEETLLSIINQNYPNLELIVIDGGSTDNSIDIIKHFSNYFSYWVSEPDGGQTHGLIKGFSRSTGEIQCWLNSDDLHEENTLFEVARYFLEHPKVDAVFGDATWINENNQVLRRQCEIPFNKYIWMYTYNYIPGMSMFWRKALYEKAGGLNAEFDLAMDADLWIRFSDVGQIKHVPRMWSRMRFYPEQKNRRLRLKSNQEELVIRSRYCGAEKPLLYQLNRIIAYAIRFAWKLSTGCYNWNYKRYMERQ